MLGQGVESHCACHAQAEPIEDEVAALRWWDDALLHQCLYQLDGIESDDTAEFARNAGCFRGGLHCLRGCYRQFGARGVMADVMIAGSAGVGCSRGRLVAFLFRSLSLSLSLSRVGSARYDAVWVLGVDRCCRGSERCV
jgi:hypothetical protein